jgi:protein-disulfide isomerase
MNRNIWFLFAFGLVAAAGLPAGVPAASAADSLAQATVALDPASLAPRKDGEDMVMGSDKAPVTVIEYASLTCPHCAHFNETTFPKLKSEYIDKGLVKYVFRDFPLDRMALTAAEVARCAGPEKYFGFIDVLFRQQMTWTNAKDADALTANLKKVARIGGMPDTAVDACLKDKAVQDAVLAQSLKGEQQFKVNSTPTIIVNGTPHPGALSFDEMEAILKPLIKKS